MYSQNEVSKLKNKETSKIADMILSKTRNQNGKSGYVKIDRKALKDFLLHFSSWLYM